MPFQSVPNTAEAVIHYTIAGVPAANVLNFHAPAGYTQADLDNLAALIDAVVGTNFLPLMHVGATYDSVVVRGLTSVIDLSSTSSGSSGPGTAGGTAIANNVAFVITHRTGRTGRSARGRTYMPALSSADMTATNATTGAYSAAVEAAFLLILTQAALIGWDFCVVSRFSLGVARAVGITTNILLSEARNNLVDSQRHRLPHGH